MVRVFSETVGDQAITPQLSWLWPSGLDASSIAQAVILCIFIYWGGDTYLAVGEETRGSDKTPGRAAVITTLILVFTYVLVAYAVQAFAGFGEEGIGLNNPENTDDVLTILGEPVAGSVAASLLLSCRCPHCRPHHGLCLRVVLPTLPVRRTERCLPCSVRWP